MKIRIFVFLLMGLGCLMGLAAALTWFWPHSGDYYYNRGSELLADSDTDEHWLVKWDLVRAQSAFDHAIELNSRFTAAYENRAAVRNLNGDWKGALADYNRAIELNPRNYSNYKGRAGIENASGDVDGALADYARAVEFNPSDRSIYMARARILETRGDIIGAVMARARMFELMPPMNSRMDTNRDYFMRRDPGRWRGRFGMRYDRVLELNTNFTWGYYHRGVVRSSQNDLNGALADFRRCQELPDNGFKDYAAIHIWLVQAQSGKGTEADQELDAYFNTRTTGTANDWPSQIARYLLNQINETNLFAAINPSETEWQQSQFWYYTGMKHLIAGDKAKAIDCFQKSVNTKTRPYAVYISARTELAALQTETNADQNQNP